MSDVEALVAALEAGGYSGNLVGGQALRVESLEPTMRVTTFLEFPTRRVDGRLQPVMRREADVRHYEFVWELHPGYALGGHWVQAPADFTLRTPPVRVFSGWGWIRPSVKRLTPRAVRLMNRKLNRIFPEGGEVAARVYG